MTARKVYMRREMAMHRSLPVTETEINYTYDENIQIQVKRVKFSVVLLVTVLVVSEFQRNMLLSSSGLKQETTAACLFRMLAHDQNHLVQQHGEPLCSTRVVIKT